MRGALVAISPFPGTALPEFRSLSDALETVGVDHLIIARREVGQPSEERQGHRTIKRLWVRNRWETETFFWQASFILRRHQTDFIHIIWRFGAAVIPLLLGSRGKQCLMDVRTGSISNQALRRWIENTLIRWERHWFTWAVTLDQELNQHLRLRAQAFLPMGISSVLLGKRKDRANRQTIREKLGFSASHVVGLYIGTAYLRQLAEMFRGFATAYQHQPNLRLVVVGDGYSNQHLQQLAEKMPITLLPSMPLEMLSEFFSAADFGISYVPTKPWFTHQQSTKILDYSVFALPVLATATKSNQRFVDDGVNGVLCGDTPADVAVGLARITTRLVDEGFIKKNRRRADELTRTYAWEYLVRQNLLPLYHQML